MKNLKRALSFAVAAVMLVGMMAIGTSAFTDDAAIENTTAVNVMNQLNIISGKPDGSFDPTATVTRGEMAKMICVALNGGKDPVLDAATTSYPDTVGHWAAGYIEYCTNLGIVAGSTDGNFYPGNPVTGTEAAKMLLIAIGYNAESEGFVNNKDWSTNINVVANKKDLYADLAVLPANALSRDNAAQMIYNAMNAQLVEYDYKLNSVGGNLTTVAVAQDKQGTHTIMIDKFALDVDEIVSVLVDVSYNKTDKVYVNKFANGQTANTEKDYSDLFMQKVTVMYNERTQKFFGMYAVDSKVVATGVVGDIATTLNTAEKVEIAEVEYKLTGTASAVNVYNNLFDTATVGTLNSFTAPAAASFKLIDNTGDGEGDVMVVFPYSVETVDYIGKTTYSLSGHTGLKVADKHNVYEGMAEDDYVIVTDKVYTVAGDVHTIVKAETVTGTANGTKGTEQVKIGSTWYTDDTRAESIFAAVELGKDYDVVVYNGYMYAAELTTEDAAAATDVVYVMAVDAAAETGSLNAGTQKVKVMFADGTTAIVTVDKYNSGAPAKNGEYEVAVDAGLVSYKVDKDGNYELTDLVSSDYAYTSDDKIVEGKTENDVYRFNADAVIWVYENDGDVSVIKGSDVAGWTGTKAANGVYYGSAKNGFGYVEFGFISISAIPGATGDAAYGVVLSDSILVYEDETYYAEMTIWNGAETIEVKAELSAAGDISNAKYAEGALVTYDVLSATEVDNVAVTGTDDAIVAYDGTNIGFKSNNSVEYVITEDTVIVYVDSDKVVGYEGGKIALAQKLENTNHYANVYFTQDDADTDLTDGQDLLALFVDVNNKWATEVEF